MGSLEHIADHVPTAEELATRFTWEQYTRIEEPEGLRFEYEEGTILMSPSGRPPHAFLRDLLLARLLRYEEDEPERCIVVAEHSFFMPPGERDYRPDVAVVVDERRLRPMATGGWFESAPDVAVEVLSPSTRERDLGLKARRYFERGSDEYWVFDPDARTARFLRRGETGWLEAPLAGSAYETPLLPGLRLDVEALWARLDAKLRVERPKDQ